jgi:hypothetical protein
MIEDSELDIIATSEAKFNALRAAARLQRSIIEARRSPIGLYKLCFSRNDGGDIYLKWFHEEWNQIFMNERNFLIEGSRGLTKTTFVTACILWMIGRNPNLRITWLSSNDSQASKRLRATRKHLKENKLYKAIFPGIVISKDKEDANTVDMLTVERDAVLTDPTVEAKGVLSTGTGSRIDVLVLDDIVDQRNALLYPNMRPMVLNKLQSDWMQTVDQAQGRIFAIFNTWHAEDAHCWLIANTRWLYKRYAHGKSGDPYHSIFEELFPRERLKELRRNEGPINYARGRLCKRQTEDTVAITSEQFVPYNRGLLTDERLMVARCFIIIDPSSGKKLEKGKLDFTGVCIMLYVSIQDEEDPSRQIGFMVFIPEAYQVKLKTRQQAHHVKQLIRQWDPEAVLIEAEGLANLHEYLLDDQFVNPEIIIPIHTKSRSKGQRLLGVSALFYPDEGHKPIVYWHPRTIEEPPSKGAVVLPDGYVADIERTAKSQIVNFPMEHDDAMDAVIHGLDYIRTWIAPEGIDFVPKVEMESVIIGLANERKQTRKQKREAARAEKAKEAELEIPPNPEDWPCMPAIDELLAQLKR